MEKVNVDLTPLTLLTAISFLSGIDSRIPRKSRLELKTQAYLKLEDEHFEQMDLEIAFNELIDEIPLSSCDVIENKQEDEKMNKIILLIHEIQLLAKEINLSVDVVIS
jgi:hypothetical protein